MAGRDVLCLAALWLKCCTLGRAQPPPASPRPSAGSAHCCPCLARGRSLAAGVDVEEVVQNATQEERNKGLQDYMDDRFNAWTEYQRMLVFLIPIAFFAWVGFRYVYQMTNTAKRQQAEFEAMVQVDPVRSLINMMVPSLQLAGHKFQGIKKPEQTVDLKFQHLGLRLKSGRTVLKDVSGEFPSGHLAAIMGSSGAGKTTFMNVLCGKATYGDMSGEVFVNGEQINMQSLKSIMGFVPQEDIVHEKLTVRENIRYSAKLRSPRGCTNSTIAKIVNDVLTVLQIGHISMSIVGGVEERGISGGQRKRVNIGLELAASPVLLFLDEPTSGLDATSSLSIINSLKKMTELGMTIIMVIHQPRYSLFSLFDTVLLLGKGGETVYLGASEKAVEYFQDLGFRMPLNENPADWCIDVLSGEFVNEKDPDFKLQALIDKWKEQSKPEEDDVQKLSKQNTNITIASTHTSTIPSAVDLRSEIDLAVDEAWAAIEAGNLVDQDKFTELITYHAPGKVHPGKYVEALWKRVCENSGQGENTDDATITFAQLTDALFAATQEKSFSHSFMESSAVPRVIRSGLLEGADQALELVTDTMTPVVELGTKLATKVPKMIGKGDDAGLNEATKNSNNSFNNDGARKIRGPIYQFSIMSERRLVQVFRNMQRRILDLTVVIFCGIILGIQHKDATNLPSNVVLFHLALSLLIPVNCLACLGSGREMFWRERSHGLVAASYSFARIMVDSVDVLMQSLTYVTVYFLTAQPPLPFVYYLEPVLCLAFVCSAWGYVISCLVPPNSSTLSTCVLMLVMNGALADPSKAGQYIDGGSMEFIVALSPARWSLQMFIIAWYDAFEIDLGRIAPYDSSVLGPIRMVNHYRSSAFDRGQDIKKLSGTQEWEATTLEEIGSTYWTSALVMLLVQGVLLRLSTVPLLIFRNADKQV